MLSAAAIASCSRICGRVLGAVLGRAATAVGDVHVVNFVARVAQQDQRAGHDELDVVGMGGHGKGPFLGRGSCSLASVDARAGTVSASRPRRCRCRRGRN